MDLLKPNVRYTISLEDIDLNFLPTKLTSSTFLKKEYYKFELRSTVDEETVQDKDETTNYEESTCHICDMRVPNAFILEHLQSDRHKICLSIANEAAERMRNQAKQHVTPTSQNPKDYLCGPCGVVIRRTDRQTHEETKQHIISGVHINLLENLANSYINIKDINTDDKDKVNLIKNDKNSNIPILRDSVQKTIETEISKCHNATDYDKINLKETKGGAVTKNPIQVEKENNLIKVKDVKVNPSVINKRNDVKEIKNVNATTKTNTHFNDNNYTAPIDGHQEIRENGQKNEPDLKNRILMNWQVYENCVNNMNSNFEIKVVNTNYIGVHVINTVYAIILARNFNGITSYGDRCMICDVKCVAEVHIMTLGHIAKVRQPIDNNFLRKLGDNSWHCLLCNLVFPIQYIKPHLTSKTHQAFIERTKTLNNTSIDGQNNNTDEWIVVGKGTKRNKNNMNTEENEKTANEEELNGCFEKTKNPRELSKLYDVDVTNSYELLNGHIKETMETSNKSKTISVIPNTEQAILLKITENINVVYCCTCKCVVPNTNYNIAEHMSGSSHKQKQKKLELQHQKVETLQKPEIQKKVFNEEEISKEEQIPKTEPSTSTEYPLKATDNPKSKYCCLCNCPVPNLDTNMKEHLVGSKHLFNQRKYYYGAGSTEDATKDSKSPPLIFDD